ncbi:hypothetical protein MODO_1306 [Myroides odoratimimus]|uniref:DUF4302 domain-containing protein n=1 Tax=Myroides odoratimimus CCUG 10230 TaxID=883150 RepID=A0ABN0E6U6_9FLAO|nr:MULTISPECIES: DUF4302 domain-containing protein [Myroides]AJA68046.1 Protein of unknown function DUF4302 [Myroides sp. A21]EHO06711.1 hypothetical protein HMPREF9712_02916 [Myroides odoratimimus CCUG 10230]MDM1064050.1 DUF4302 domain-containing protein [Myroides odoratimimus]MDM1083515.1 DUF4302 domain-containing protein [Myroides odoratimimus]MDM1456132.1 DUF4302 domain-containing protein [Myroides odoratimimus]
MKKYITKAFLATIILAGIASCQKEEDRVFDESVAERLSEQEKKLQDLLLSSEYGWKLVYNTSEGDFGSYTYLMRFKDTRNVEMVSDFDASGPISEVTEYAIHQRATASLVFTTRSKIHQLSDPANSPYAAGKGYYGEYQFGYYGNTENEIYFRTPKQDQELTFVKATKEDWETFNQQYTMVDNMNSLSKPYFRVVDVEVAGKVERFDFTNLGSVRMVDLQGNKLFKDSDYALTYNTRGFIVTPAMEVGGQKITSFLYDEISDSFIGKEGNVKVSFKYSNKPVVWTDMSYKKLLSLPTNPKEPYFMFRTGSSYQILGSKFTSVFLRNKIAEYGKGANGEYKMSAVNLTFNTTVNTGSGVVPCALSEYVFEGKSYVYFFQLKELQGNVVQVVPLGWNTLSLPAQVIELNDLFLGENLYIRKERGTVQYSNPVITFISSKAPIVLPTWDYDVIF